ncbi:hypothetical protein BN59_02527 [Legionella massiliensis]|uniref:Uncharacterized protein n=1 Tax=Legionella massiliensis TaxID=1034943 RepID=A0A078L2A3_9GAMM|nr:hypothetical protein [Legionella massiliensis]CDZ78219.1 hypothetical protein BN59_02527 [Legionella massiliensis]CEE13957.1 hypothetical protein BN1094_02527 [Legionella massiliensis]
MSIGNIFKEKFLASLDRTKAFLTGEWSWWSFHLLVWHSKKLLSMYGAMAIVSPLVSTLPWMIFALCFSSPLTTPGALIVLGVMGGIFLLPLVPLVITHILLPAINLITNFALAATIFTVSILLIPILAARHAIHEAINKSELDSYDEFLYNLDDSGFEKNVIKPLRSYTPSSTDSEQLRDKILSDAHTTTDKKAYVSLFLKDEQRPNLGRGATNILFSIFTNNKNKEATLIREDEKKRKDVTALTNERERFASTTYHR